MVEFGISGISAYLTTMDEIKYLLLYDDLRTVKVIEIWTISVREASNYLVKREKKKKWTLNERWTSRLYSGIEDKEE